MKKVKYFEHNKIGTDYIVGDLHGCLDELNHMLDHVKFDKSKDRLFSVGDLVDRGPKSKECAELIYEKWFHCVLGNHEQMMVTAIASNGVNNYYWYSNGGTWAIDEDIQWLEAVCMDLERLPLVIVIGKAEDQRINIVHAEFMNNKALESVTNEDIDDWFFNPSNEDNLVWGRNICNYNSKGLKPEGLSTTYVGHTPTPNLREVYSHRFIDGDAVYWHLQKYASAKLSKS